MTDESLLSDLLVRWADAHNQGRDPTPAELCHDAPHLAGELGRRIAAVRRAEPPPGATASTAPPAVPDLTSDAAPRPVGPAAVFLPEVPFQLGPFEVLEKLGEGGMGQVYRARDPHLEREVALKLMGPSVAGHPTARARFLREARLAASLRDDHIVTVYQAGEADGWPFLAMELLRGESLADRLERQERLPVAEAVRVARETSRGLAAAHEAGLVHRDLKPANLWLEFPGEPGASATGGRVKILDFGLACPVEQGGQLTAAGVLVGTPGYLAPEQVEGLPADARTDLFGLGCVLYLMVTGEPAFPGRRLAAVCGGSFEDPVPAHVWNPEVPEALSALITRLLARKPDDRPASARAVVELLEGLEAQPAKAPAPAPGAGPAAAGSATSASPALPGPPRAAADTALVRPAAPRRWPWAALAAGVVLAAVAAGLVWWWPSAAGVDPPGPVPATPREVVPAAPLTATLDLRAWKKEDTTNGRTLGERGVLPLRAGDYVRIEAKASRPAYLYVIYLEAEGTAAPLYPWRDDDWNNRPAERPRSELHLPDREGVDISPLAKGPSGIECVLLLAREQVLSDPENARLKQLLTGKPQRGKFDPLRGAVWLDGAAERFGDDTDRARPLLAQGVATEDPVQRVRRLLTGELAPLAAVRRGVCFPFEGR
jgi:hypothetical protein